MLLLCIACLISFSPGAFGAFYQLEGHLNTISTAQIEGKEHKRGLFQEIEHEIHATIKEVLANGLEEFFVSHFELQGPRKTPIFHANLKTDLTRDSIIQFIHSSSKLTLFYLKEIDSMPIPPSITATGIDAGVTSCANGGVLLPNSTCACPAFFKGDRCDTVKCLHQGIQEDSRCACPPGVYSMNCEPRACLPAIEETLDISSRSFVLVINTKSSMAYVLNTLFFSMQSFLNETATNYKIVNYIVVTYVSGASYDYVTPRIFYSPESVVNYLYGVVHVSDGNAEQQTNYAIFTAETFSSQIQPFSSVFVFTDSADSDAKPVDYTLSSGTIENQVILQTNAWRHKIMYLISQPKGKPLDDSDDFYGTYKRVAQATFGDIVSFDQTEITKVISPLMSSYQFVEFIEARYSSSVNQNVTLFPDDPSQTVKILITVGPSGILPTVQNTKRQQLQSDVTGTRFMLISVNSTIANGLTVISAGTPWSVKAFVSSTSTAIVSYNLDPQIDVGDAFTSAELSNVATIAPLGFTGPIMLSWKNVQNGSSIFVGTLAKQRTQECTFSWATTSIKTICTPGPFTQYLSLKSGGSDVVRVLPGFCGVLDHTSPPPFQCLNGGTMFGGSCICDSNFNGTDCSIPICLYGGSPNPFPGNGNGLCSCPQGYLGDHCELLICRSESQDFFSNYGRSFGMVMQTSMSQSEVSGSIHQGLTEMLGLLTDSGDLFSEYYLTTFSTGLQNGQNSSRIATQTFQSAKIFSSAVNQTGYLASSASTQDSFGALFDAMKHSNFDRASFFLFVDSPPSATANEMDIVLTAIDREFEINVIITPPFEMEDLCLTKPDPFITIAQKTGGVIYNLCNQQATYSGDPIVDFFQSFGISHHHTENVAEGASPSCRAQTELIFQVDNSSAQHFLIVNSDYTENFTATLTDLDSLEEVILTPISNTPMLAVYNLSVRSGSYNGYSAKIVAAPGTTYGSCYSRIAEKTKVAAYLGFSPDPSEDALSKFLTFATPSFPVIHIDRNNPNSVTIDAVDDSGSDHYSSTDVKRQTTTCEYESYFTDPFICDSNGGTFILTIKTTTDDGRTIQRSRRALCYIRNGFCLNGAFYVNGECKCSAGYYGQYCEYPRCAINSEYNNYQCICGSSFTGPLCQYDTCSKLNFMESADPRESNFKQITFVVNINMDQFLVNNYLSTIIQKFVDDTETHVPKQYSLLLFDDKTVTKVASTSRASDFVSLFQKAMTTKVSSASGVPTISLDAINEAYKINIDPPSIIYLITGTDAAKSSVASSLIKQRLGTQVNIIYTPANVVYPGQPGGSYGPYLSIAARQTGGRIWPITQGSIPQLEAALATTVVANALVFDDAAKDCFSPVKFRFTLEAYFTTAYIEITGIDVNQANRVSFSNNLYGNVTIDPSMVLFQDNAAIIYAIQHVPNTMLGGLWTVTVQTTSGSCFVQVRTKSPVRVVPGFTSNPNADFVKDLPFSQYGTTKESYMTFRLVDQGTANLFTNIESVDITSGDFDKPWSGAKALGALSVKQRDIYSCASQYISELWRLDAQAFQKFVVSGVDDSENEFQRTFFYYFPKPSAADIAATCQNGQRNQNGECICDAFHAGDYCSERLCQNGGSQSFGICVCPDGFYGDYCEQFVGCTPLTTPGLSTIFMSSATPIQNSPTTSSFYSSTASPSPVQSTTVSSPITTPSALTQTTSASTVSQPTAAQTSATSFGTLPPISAATATILPPVTGTVTIQQDTTTTASLSNPTGPTTTFGSTISNPTGPTTMYGSTTYGSTVSAPVETTTVPQSPSTVLSTAALSSTASTVTTTVSSTVAATTTAATTTVATTTTEMKTTASTVNSIVHCDPYTTTYMVSLFLDATDMFDDPFMGTLYKGENLIVQSLAQQLYLGNGMENTRFVMSSIASTFQPGTNVTSLDDINTALQGLASPQGADLVYNLTNALEQYQSGDMWQFGKTETPPIAVFFCASPISDMDSVPDQLKQLSLKGYKSIAVNVAFDNNVQAQLTSLFGSDNVYESITADDTATWIRNKICKFKPL